ncbi:calcium-binding protein [Ensifer adhaerens]|uniref:calcium-binding protein n=1 Tax=Ensifer adhaerens TaxID=106592 RepID=UPI0011783B2F|nr:calcium-binding protein [Ensifer adhaerens]
MALTILRGSNHNTSANPMSAAHEILDSLIKRGVDPIRMKEGEVVRAANGNGQVIVGGAFSDIDGTSGDDLIQGGLQSSVNGGAGNDNVFTLGLGSVDGGAGDDEIYVLDRSQAFGGDGNDKITGHGSIVDGGAGDDWIQIMSGRYVAGVVDGGAGNDRISAIGSGNVVQGGSGEDTISLIGWTPQEGSPTPTNTVKFAIGDGKDSIRALATDVTIELGEGITAENTEVTFTDNKAIIRFKNSQTDEITVQLSEGNSLVLAFADGRRSETLQVKPAEIIEIRPTGGPAAVVAAYQEH